MGYIALGFMKLHRLLHSVRKHRFDGLLIALSLMCVVVMLISSSDPVLPSIQGTAVHDLLKQFQTGNQIAFDLSVGLLAGVFMYYLVVRVPEQGQRRRLRANLVETYRSFKEESIAVYLGCFMSSYPAELPGALSEQAEFRKFFNEQYAPGQDRWHAVANGLDDDRLKTLVVELEILMQEIHFTLSAIDIQDHRAFQVLKHLSKIIYRSKNWTTEYDDVKSMMRFLWSLHTGWNWADGYAESDPIAEMIAAI
ncbi:MAG: hypothetical protein C0445_05520 [Polaromonas sp.]|nr:hypothetical protein [Polaromonas sp.]